MNKFFSALLLAFSVLLPAAAAPVFQPQVKEYQPRSGSFPIAELPVFFQDQKQCEIAASELPGTGKKIKGFNTSSAKGIYIAVAGSPEGKILIKDFSLDIPQKKQGYTIKASDGKIAIVGFDSFGTLYGAVTLRQMAENGKITNAVVRDYPDILYRGAMSYGRGIIRWDYGEKDLSGSKAAIDELLRHKVNIITDFHRMNHKVTEAEFAKFAEVCRYAEERGFWICIWPGTNHYNHFDKPEGLTLQKWHCVSDARPARKVESYFCWADDEATAATAERYSGYLRKFGASRLYLVIHPVDGGAEKDPEKWSKRCQKCRAKYGDHERWKASLAQFKIWNSVLRKNFPQAVIGSCIYPYHADMLALPKSKRDKNFNLNVTEYWKHISDGMEDQNFFFNIWMPGRSIMKEYRELVGSKRVLNYTDHYCTTAGIFATYHRYAASLYNENVENIYLSVASDKYGQWESMFLMAEHTWNKNAPGSEVYPGGAFYDGLKDHTGPAVIMENTLPKICHTFWGEKIAPYMIKVMSSGIMPDYISNPAPVISYWNKVRRDPMYDPNVKKATLVAGSLPPVIDSPELMKSQIAAAQIVCDNIAEAVKYADTVDKYKRKYLYYFAKRAPFFLAAARAQYHIRIAGELVAQGKNEAALKELDIAAIQLDKDYTAAETNLAALAKYPDTGGRRLGWPLDRKAMTKQLDDARKSAQVLLQPRRIGRFIKIGITKGDSAKGIKEYLDNFVNVRTTIIDNISLAELDKYDCVFITHGTYKKGEFFQNIPAYVNKGGGGVFFEGIVCGHERFDTKTPFPEIVKTAVSRVDNFNRQLKKIDGSIVKSMYVDYYILDTGKNAEVRVTSTDGKPVIVRGKSGIGKVVFCGIVGLEGVNDSFITAQKELFGINAEAAKEAVEYFTGIKLRKKKK